MITNLTYKSFNLGVQLDIQAWRPSVEWDPRSDELFRHFQRGRPTGDRLLLLRGLQGTWMTMVIFRISMGGAPSAKAGRPQCGSFRV